MIYIIFYQNSVLTHAGFSKVTPKQYNGIIDHIRRYNDKSAYFIMNDIGLNRTLKIFRDRHEALLDARRYGLDDSSVILIGATLGWTEIIEYLNTKQIT